MGILERPRFFARQLITPEEMNLIQTSFRDKLRRHNRLLHGWGVVCGAEVCAAVNEDKNGLKPWKVWVKPGYALGPAGDEIVIGKKRELDLRVDSAVGACGDIGHEMADPWCRPVYRESLPEWVYIAVRYHEIMTRQVRVQPAGCSCDDTSCEYSRYCDGYEFGILTRCPPSHENPPSVDLAALLSRPLVACPECPEDDWVVLAAVRLDQNGRILAIDNCSCRRMIVTFATVWGTCTSGGLRINDVVIDPADVKPGEEYTVTIHGANFQQNTKIELGDWASISNSTITATVIKFSLAIDSNAPIGDHTFVLTNPDCSLATATIRVTGKENETYHKKGAAVMNTAAPPIEPSRRAKKT
jgi:hypothetical protein